MLVPVVALFVLAGALGSGGEETQVTSVGRAGTTTTAGEPATIAPGATTTTPAPTTTAAPAPTDHTTTAIGAAGLPAGEDTTRPR